MSLGPAVTNVRAQHYWLWDCQLASGNAVWLITAFDHPKT
jgi:hypothetical protein